MPNSVPLGTSRHRIEPPCRASSSACSGVSAGRSPSICGSRRDDRRHYRPRRWRSGSGGRPPPRHVSQHNVHVQANQEGPPTRLWTTYGRTRTTPNVEPTAVDNVEPGG
eukprot:3685393-Prymnesium_polylepis.1